MTIFKSEVPPVPTSTESLQEKILTSIFRRIDTHPEKIALVFIFKLYLYTFVLLRYAPKTQVYEFLTNSSMGTRPPLRPSYIRGEGSNECDTSGFLTLWIQISEALVIWTSFAKFSRIALNTSFSTCQCYELEGLCRVQALCSPIVSSNLLDSLKSWILVEMQRQFLDSQSKCVITNEENLDRVLKAVNGCPKVTVWRENSLKPIIVSSWILDSHLREVNEKTPAKRSLLLRTSHIDAYRLDTQIPIQVYKESSLQF